MPIKEIYTIPERAVASYSYVDIAEGVGVRTFYGYNVDISGATSWDLVNNSALFSHDIETTQSVNTNHAWEYDLAPFAMPQLVKGTAVIRFSENNSAADAEAFFKVELIKVSEGAEEILGTAESTIKYGNVAENITMKMDIAQTHFKRDDYIRLRLTVNTTKITNITIGHDPANRAGTVLTDTAVTPTKLEVLVPFKIEL